LTDIDGNLTYEARVIGVLNMYGLHLFRFVLTSVLTNGVEDV